MCAPVLPYSPHNISRTYSIHMVPPSTSQQDFKVYIKWFYHYVMMYTILMLQFKSINFYIKILRKEGYNDNILEIL